MTWKDEYRKRSLYFNSIMEAKEVIDVAVKFGAKNVEYHKTTLPLPYKVEYLTTYYQEGEICDELRNLGLIDDECCDENDYCVDNRYSILDVYGTNQLIDCPVYN